MKRDAAASGDMAGSGSSASGARITLLACCATHSVTDGLISAVYPLLPLIAADLQLSYTAVGSLRTALTASSSTLQIPAGYLAGWLPEAAILGGGMLWMSIGFAALALAAGFWPLLGLITLAGIGGNAQHPLATAMVSQAYDSGRRGSAISSLNFSGDLGKVLLPSLAGLAAVGYGWRGAFFAMGAAGVIASIGYAIALRRIVAGERRASPARGNGRGWGIQNPAGFALLASIGILDNAVRVGSLTFLPFLLTDKGLDAAGVSFLITLVFAFGAAGKLGCGLLADRFGNTGVIVVTEVVTAAALLAAIPADPVLVVPVLAVLGFVGNGTSSALYSAVAEMVHVDRRAQGYGLYYTLSLGTGVLAPILLGAMADSVGIPGAFVAMAVIISLTLPLARVARL